MVPPSSHCSVKGFNSPFPQKEEQVEAGGVVQVYPYSIWQEELQPFPPKAFPTSHVSVPSIAEFPQI